MNSIIFFLSLCLFSPILGYEYETKYMDVPLDHFSYVVNNTFKLRYLVNDKNWAKDGPIFFYCGNEGDITMFADNTGFMFDIAPLFDALIIFAEHRYYGETLPFGNQSYTGTNLGYLTSSQALADYVYVLDKLQKLHARDVNKLPVIAFGGSYGGMLAAWFRMKYPATVAGAIAASAPVYQFTGLTECDVFNRIVTSDFKYAVPDVDCSEIIKRSWSILTNLPADGKTFLTNEWKLCKPLNDSQSVTSWLTDLYGNMAMANYPYPATFLAPMPGYPIKEFCSKLAPAEHANNTQLIKLLGAALQVYTNYTGTTKCIDLGESAAPTLGDAGWGFQACTEIIMPMCSSDNDMFINSPWNFTEYAEQCYKTYGVYPADNTAILEYGGKQISASSNIVFSNGLLDPWSGGGVLNNVSNTVAAIIIPEGAHHLDLRGVNPEDPQSVIKARNFHIAAIQKWLKEFYISEGRFYNF